MSAVFPSPAVEVVPRPTITAANRADDEPSQGGLLHQAHADLLRDHTRVIMVGVAGTSIEVTVKGAVVAGPAGEARLVQMLDSVTGFGRVLVVAALGDAQGAQGPAALRRLLALPPRSVDLRCAGLLALAKREGAAASDVLAAHLHHVPGAVRDYAILGMAGVGDDRSWSHIHTILKQQLGRPPPATPPTQLMAGLAQFKVLTTVTYLLRHLHPPTTDRTVQLAATLRARFDRLHTVEQDWLTTRWPSLAPAGPDPLHSDPPDPEVFRDWVRATRLFGPAF